MYTRIPARYKSHITTRLSLPQAVSFQLSPYISIQLARRVLIPYSILVSLLLWKIDASVSDYVISKEKFKEVLNCEFIIQGAAI
jgi:hypothetical protein